MRRRYFTLSQNSLHETVGAVDLAATLGMMSTEQADAIQSLAYRLMTALPDPRTLCPTLPVGGVAFRS